MTSSGDQPSPTPDNIPSLVIKDIVRRGEAGAVDDGTAPDDKDALNIAYEKALDLAVYLRQAMLERDESLSVMEDLQFRVQQFESRIGLPGEDSGPPLVEDANSLEFQTDRLAQFIIQHVPGEPSQDLGAIDTAIEILKRHYGDGPSSG